MKKDHLIKISKKLAKLNTVKILGYYTKSNYFVSCYNPLARHALHFFVVRSLKKKNTHTHTSDKTTKLEIFNFNMQL